MQYLVTRWRHSDTAGGGITVQPAVTPLVTHLPRSHHLIILGQSKRVEEREFEPELLGKTGLLPGGVGSDIRKPHEQPSIGVLLSASKNDEVVEYSLSLSLSPTLIAQYETQLPDKKLLQAKLHEFYLQMAIDSKPCLGKASIAYEETLARLASKAETAIVQTASGQLSLC